MQSDTVHDEDRLTIHIKICAMNCANKSKMPTHLYFVCYGTIKPGKCVQCLNAFAQNQNRW